MIPFNLPAWRKAHIKTKYNRKDLILTAVVESMEMVMEDAIESMFMDVYSSDQFVAPDLSRMFMVSKRFYEAVVKAAWVSADEEKRAQQGKKRLAKPGPIGLPKNFKDFDTIFKDRTYWKRIMKRSDLLTERLRKAYLQKLRKSFNQVIPMLRSGEITPYEAKNYMMGAWKASKPRVETIFRTETTNYFGKAQVAFFEDDDEIIGFLFDSLKDVATTDICRTRHGLIYKPGTKLLTENTPALHWNCRSHLIALANTPANRRMVSDPKRDPSNRSVAPLPPKWKK